VLTKIIVRHVVFQSKDAFSLLREILYCVSLTLVMLILFLFPTSDKNLNQTIPLAETLVGNKIWNGVSTEAARFEILLMQLGKTDSTVTDLDQMAKRTHAPVATSRFRIFLYSLEQLGDSDDSRAKDFRYEMQNFMGLKTSIPPFGQNNINHAVGKKAHPETLDICKAKYRGLRSKLIAQGLKTRKWIRNQFIVSEDVTVGGKEYFLELMDAWGIDPCEEKKNLSKE